MIVSVSIILLSLAVFVASGGALVFSSHTAPSYTYPYKIGETVNPMDRFNFEHGDWSAWIVMTRDDRKRLPSGMPNATVLTSHDRSVLKRLQNDLRFTYQNADVATVTSRLLVYRGKELVFETGIVIEAESEGLQNQDFGWLKVTRVGAFRDICKDFRRVWSPFVRL